MISTQGERTESQIKAAEEHSKSLLEHKDPPAWTTGSTRKYRSLPKQELGPLPPNTVSEYLETTGADYTLNSRTLQGNLVLFLRARQGLPRGAYVEAAFPDPSDIKKTNVVGKRVNPGQKIMLESPPTRDLKCWNYLVQVTVYRNQSREEMIGLHRQVIQSGINLRLVKRGDGLVSAVIEGLCSRDEQKDFSDMPEKELEALCEQEREKRLAPEREQLIERCVSNQDKSREYCENYYTDHGDAVRINPGQMRPARYMDLPECVAARKAKEESR